MGPGRPAHEVAAFFRTSTNYLYNLTIWEASGNRPDYISAALPQLATHDVRTVLNIGSGTGSDSLAEALGTALSGPLAEAVPYVEVKAPTRQQPRRQRGPNGLGQLLDLLEVLENLSP